MKIPGYQITGQRSRLQAAVGLMVVLGLACVQCSAGSGGCGRQAATRAFSFVVMGDTQPHLNGCQTPPTATELMAFNPAIRKLNPDFVLHVGDLMDRGREPDAYEKFYGCFHEILDRFPFFPTVGNHDMDYNLGHLHFKKYLEHQLFVRNPMVFGDGYLAQFKPVYMDDKNAYSRDHKKPQNQKVLPSGYTFKNYYSFKYRNVYFISMDVGTRWEINTPLPWLEARLSAARAMPGIEHLVVVMHHSLYSVYMSELSGGDCLVPLRRPYEPLFRKYKVTAVFAGHVHLHERFYVPNDGRPTATKTPPKTYPHDGRGIHYVTVGPSGSGFVPWLGKPVPPPLKETSLKFLQGFGRGHNMARVEVNGSNLKITIIGVEGTRSKYTTRIWDSFSIAKVSDHPS